ncbi:tetratricopeptide repeat family protein [Orientia tsutsugamushi str. Gilliam]|uniref:Tetratricopeptide repeat family protein n=1 Tax=Orientia tsutsugamushi str. Gilliam TaxID=1359184 RepID=A0A0F3M5X9_ORITS|nr:tetratricopeptide repeat protein [Orientia tsutsugamushi]KJV51046.1 tetratricopeptide repeat family protein [Orientia tsutsugamushi str. Gilliam]
MKKQSKNYDIAIKYNSSYPEAYYNKGIALMRLGYIQEAIENYDIAIRYRPNYSEAYYNKGFHFSIFRTIAESNRAFLI